jgi:hypothetical protein
MAGWVATLSVVELLGTALVAGVVGGTLVGSIPIALWLVYEWVDERLCSRSHSEAAPTPPRRLNG